MLKFKGKNNKKKKKKKKKKIANSGCVAIGKYLNCNTCP